MVERETPKRSEASFLGMPRSIAESTFSLRSFEYAFIMDLFSCRSATYASSCNEVVLEMTFVLEFWQDLRKSIRQDSAVPLRRTLKKYADIFEDAPMDAGDQELMDDVSVNLAEVISGKLQNCRMGLSSSVDLDTDPKGPGIFLMLSSPPDLLSAAYVQPAQFMADRAPMEECPGCGRVFIPSSGKQKYCSKSCASTTRWHRWKQKQAE